MELPDEDTDRAMYHETKRRLAKAGYGRYEISNYARGGYACEHNCGYWRRREYLGFGTGAASLIHNTRFQNCRDRERYVRDPVGCREDVQVLSVEEQMEEFMFLGLRLTEGVSLEEFGRCFGRSMEQVYGEVIRRKIQEGLLYRPEEGKLALTELGLDVSNYVMQAFLLT